MDELLREGVVSLEYASVMRQEGTWATDVEMMRAAQMSAEADCGGGDEAEDDARRCAAGGGPGV